MKLVVWSSSLAMGIPEHLGLRREDLLLPALSERLDWGPLHPDRQTQQLLRECYFRTSHHAPVAFDGYLQQITPGEELVFWCERVLPGCLIILWALDLLAASGVSLQNASLALSPRAVKSEPMETEALRRALTERVPIGEDIEPLLAVWRHIASDSFPIAPDLSDVPEPVRGWVIVTERMADHVPDDRGLDLVDSILLDTLTRRWRRTALVLIDCFHSEPRGHDISDRRLTQRLLEMGGYTLDWPAIRPPGEESLVEMCYKGVRGQSLVHFRITQEGMRVRQGGVASLEQLSRCRWVGGRMITNASSLRPKRGQN